MSIETLHTPHSTLKSNMAPASSVDISVVIPSYRHPDKIATCIQSLLRQKTSASYEIIVVDSSPADMQSQVAKVCAVDDRITFIPLAKQTFPGTARNEGIKRSTAEIIALIDADCEALPGWLETIRKYTTDGVILNGVLENGTPDSAVGTSAFMLEFSHFLPIRQETAIITGAGAGNFACKREVFTQRGYFTDDRAFEDILLLRRFIDSGGNILKVNDLRIIHHNKTDLKANGNNLRMLGQFSASVRHREGMPPKAVFKFPPLAFALGIFRYLSVASRVLRTEYAGRFLLYTPILLYLIAEWSMGFYEGAKATRKVS